MAAFAGRWAILDMDGTLTDTMDIWRELPALLVRRQGVEPPEGLAERMRALSFEEGALYLREAFGLPFTPEALQREMLETVAEAYKTAALRPGCREALEALRRRGATLCVLSSTPQELVRPLLGRLGVLDLLAFTMSCDPVHGKRTPEPYWKAMHRLGAPNAAATAVFEDAPFAVRAAARGGFPVYVLREKGNLAEWVSLQSVARCGLQTWADFNLD